MLGELVKQVRIPTELADMVAQVLRESQSDKESFARSTLLRLQQQQHLVRAQLDCAYDDRLSGSVSDELWANKSAELERELQRVRTEMEQAERASHAGSRNRRLAPQVRLVPTTLRLTASFKSCKVTDH
jgi:hypothetical protein